MIRKKNKYMVALKPLGALKGLTFIHLTQVFACINLLHLMYYKMRFFIYWVNTVYSNPQLYIRMFEKTTVLMTSCKIVLKKTNDAPFSQAIRYSNRFAVLKRL